MSRSSEMPEGPKVVWARTDWPAVEGAPKALPGVLVHELPDGWAFVAWADKEGWVTPDAVYETKYLAPFRTGSSRTS